MIKWLDRRAWRIVMDPEAKGEKLRRARRRVRRQQAAADGVAIHIAKLRQR